MLVNKKTAHLGVKKAWVSREHHGDQLTMSLGMIDKALYNALVNWCGWAADKTVIIKPEPRRRTLPQNAYMHLIFSHYADFVGDTLESTKFWLKCQGLKEGKYPPFLTPDGGMVTVDNTEYHMPRSTAKCSVAEIKTFIDWLIIYLQTEHDWSAPTTEQATAMWKEGGDDELI